MTPGPANGRSVTVAIGHGRQAARQIDAYLRGTMPEDAPGSAQVEFDRKLGPGKGFAIDYDYRKGCGLGVAERPCGAIEMVPEESDDG